MGSWMPEESTHRLDMKTRYEDLGYMVHTLGIHEFVWYEAYFDLGRLRIFSLSVTRAASEGYWEKRDEKGTGACLMWDGMTLTSFDLSWMCSSRKPMDSLVSALSVPTF